MKGEHQGLLGHSPIQEPPPSSHHLIGNKIDLGDERNITTDQGGKLAKEIEASDFIETSAKIGENVEKAFSNLVHQILRNYGETI